MVAFSTAWGASAGLATVLYANWLQKIPLMRRPWEHVMGITAGTLISWKMDEWCDKAEESIREKTAARVAAQRSIPTDV